MSSFCMSNGNKDQYFNQSIETGLNEEEKKNYKKFIKEYEDYKNLYNIRNHQNITEIRDVDIRDMSEHEISMLEAALEYIADE